MMTFDCQTPCPGTNVITLEFNRAEGSGLVNLPGLALMLSMLTPAGGVLGGCNGGGRGCQGDTSNP